MGGLKRNTLGVMAHLDLVDDVSADGGGASVVFVDLVAFTALTDIHGDLAAAVAASLLEGITLQSLPRGSRLVKSLGDGVLLIAETPELGLTCAARIVEALHDSGTGSDARGGVHHGVVIERDGDIFGSTVNMAARLAALADRGKLVLTRSVALAAGAARLSAAPLGQTSVRGFRDPIELFSIDPCRHDANWLADPVCGMRVEAQSVVGQAVVDGRRVGFCSQRCAELFSQP